MIRNIISFIKRKFWYFLPVLVPALFLIILVTVYPSTPYSGWGLLIVILGFPIYVFVIGLIFFVVWVFRNRNRSSRGEKFRELLKFALIPAVLAILGLVLLFWYVSVGSKYLNPRFVKNYLTGKVVGNAVEVRNVKYSIVDGNGNGMADGIKVNFDYDIGGFASFLPLKVSLNSELLSADGTVISKRTHNIETNESPGECSFNVIPRSWNGWPHASNFEKPLKMRVYYAGADGTISGRELITIPITAPEELSGEIEEFYGNKTLEYYYQTGKGYEENLVGCRKL